MHSDRAVQSLDSKAGLVLDNPDLGKAAECLVDHPRLSADPWSVCQRYLSTLLHLEAIQIYSRFRQRPSPRTVARTSRFRTFPGQWIEAISRDSVQTAPNRFRLLNEERDIVTWNDAGIPKLWLYNLHYFAYSDAALIERWIKENPIGTGVGWDPYPTSLRIANWCKWALSQEAVAQNICDSIATQTAWLEGLLETHLLANHLLANAKALIFAGALLDCVDSPRWYELGMRLLQKELTRQILNDGAHVERSPMYHSIVLEDLLDLCNLGCALGRLIPEISRYIPAMLAWLDHMTHPDGQIALFNDASFGIAPDPATLHAYARRLGFEAEPISLGESGYLRLETKDLVLIFDAAALGPDYHPGHGHADALSFELSHCGRRVLVNSGTSTYEKNATRAFERGTAAHNTMRLDGVDQSEMWAAFRVARRARTFDLATDHQTFVAAAHDGYRLLHPSLTHRRRIDVSPKYVQITDRLEGYGRHKAEIFFHLAPCVDPSIELDPQFRSSVGYSYYSTGWNLLIPNRAIVGRWDGDCPTQFVTRVRFD
jgi:hypothetical protein